MVERLTKRLEEILQECDDETMVRCPTEEELLDLDKVPDLFTDAEPGDEDDDPGLDEASMQRLVVFFWKSMSRHGWCSLNKEQFLEEVCGAAAIGAAEALSLIHI